MRFCDFYDILDARGAFYGKIRACRRLLDQFGCPDKEIWSAEVLCIYPLLGKQALTTITAYPYPGPSKSKEYRKILKKPKNRDFEKINAWYRGMQAAQLVKVCMAVLHAGSKKVMMQYALDIQSGRVMEALGILTFSGLAQKP